MSHDLTTYIDITSLTSDDQYIDDCEFLSHEYASLKHLVQSAIIMLYYDCLEATS